MKEILFLFLLICVPMILFMTSLANSFALSQLSSELGREYMTIKYFMFNIINVFIAIHFYIGGVICFFYNGNKGTK